MFFFNDIILRSRILEQPANTRINIMENKLVPSIIDYEEWQGFL